MHPQQNFPEVLTHSVRFKQANVASLPQNSKTCIFWLLCFLGAFFAASAMASTQGRPEPVSDQDFYADGQFPPAQVELGRILFFDKILSGNRNIACATCHHPDHGMSDGLSLGLGEGATGLGQERKSASPLEAVVERVPRNSPALFFVGAREVKHMFHDGRVTVDPNANWESGFWSPAREQLPEGLDNVLAVQAMFPVTSPVEMAGQKGENPVATAAALGRLAGEDGVWELLAARLREVPEYVRLFRRAYPGKVRGPEDITFVLAANAIATFEAASFRADGSPFDEYLRTGDRSALGEKSARGLDLFNGKAGCSHCHSGKLLSDQEFHAIAMPQIGPGKHDGFDQAYWDRTGFIGRFEDFGRYRETNQERDRYAFRTPILRNVALTGPWGHAGTYDSLEAVVRHHLDPVYWLDAYQPESQAILPVVNSINELVAMGSELMQRPVNPARLEDYRLRDFWVQNSSELRTKIASVNSLGYIALSDSEVEEIVAFLQALTDPASKDLSYLVPMAVPSGLPVPD